MQPSGRFARALELVAGFPNGEVKATREAVAWDARRRLIPSAGPLVTEITAPQGAFIPLRSQVPMRSEDYAELLRVHGRDILADSPDVFSV
jgi:hypothetical protein